ncbi:MAG: hypothetical protein AAGK04_08585, partial [Planctomycetota bacterium]
GVNCIGCHASEFQGEVVIGLGNSMRDWHGHAHDYTPLRILAAMAYAPDAAELDTLKTFLRGAEALNGNAGTPFRGPNPAFRFEEIAAAHRNPADLTWSEAPLYPYGDTVITSDVPPWWNVKKKTSLYYNGMGHGDFARLIQQIGVVLMGDAADAERVDPHMHDLLAYIQTLEAPPYPLPIDATLAERGAELFAANCADCHGTYAQHPHETDTYPNKRIPLDKIGTDPLYAQHLRESGLHDWFNQSWFAKGDTTYAEPKLTYVAPPLDGVWITAPYFHNGSVPTLEGVLNSEARPTRWRRSFDSHDYDLASPGWRFESVDRPTDDRNVYDTAIPGYGNQGHTFGDDLSDAERRAIIEYLKTL